MFNASSRAVLNFLRTEFNYGVIYRHSPLKANDGIRDERI